MLLLKSVASSLPLLFTFLCNRSNVRHIFSASKRTNPSADRNCPPIADALRCQLNRDKRNLKLLEIASGTGQHAGYLAPLFPNVVFQPSEVDPVHLPSIKAYAEDCTTNNILEPILIDVSVHPKNWNIKFDAGSMDYMLNINMVHISAFDVAEGLFQAAGFLLKPEGKMFTYGPYAVNGEISPHSNVMFDESLRTRNPEWGIRDIADLMRLAKVNGLKLTQQLDMPANNKTLTWTKL